MWVGLEEIVVEKLELIVRPSYIPMIRRRSLDPIRKHLVSCLYTYYLRICHTKVNIGLDNAMVLHEHVACESSRHLWSFGLNNFPVY